MASWTIPEVNGGLSGKIIHKTMEALEMYQVIFQQIAGDVMIFHGFFHFFTRFPG
jgi:hypothetical protein